MTPIRWPSSCMSRAWATWDGQPSIIRLATFGVLLAGLVVVAIASMQRGRRVVMTGTDSLHPNTCHVTCLLFQLSFLSMLPLLTTITNMPILQRFSLRSQYGVLVGLWSRFLSCVSRRSVCVLLFSCSLLRHISHKGVTHHGISVNRSGSGDASS